jgi:hypothetical protein
MANVSSDEFSLDPEGTEFLGQGMSLLVMAAGHDNPGTVLSEGQGRGAAYTGQGAGNQDNGGGHMEFLLQRDIAEKPCSGRHSD